MGIYNALLKHVCVISAIRWLLWHQLRSLQGRGFGHLDKFVGSGALDKYVVMAYELHRDIKNVNAVMLSEIENLFNFLQGVGSKVEWSE